MPLPLSELLPDEDYRFHLTLRRGNLPEFFGSPDPSVLEERKDWLSRHPERFAGVMPGADEAIAELGDLASKWPGISIPPRPQGQSPLARVIELGGVLGADFMLMTRDETGVSRLRAGAVCFPSMWALEEKMGKTLEDIHGHVPGLNPAIGGAIGQFLGRLKPDAPYKRANWGLAATSELNLHPSLGRPRLVSPIDASKTWLRVEDQIFAALPASGAILFGIQIRLVAFSEIAGDPCLRDGLRRAMATMSEPLASYKGLADVRGEVIGALSQA
jgi:dimethylamine monooxygenase subunit A